MTNREPHDAAILASFVEPDVFVPEHERMDYWDSLPANKQRYYDNLCVAIRNAPRYVGSSEPTIDEQYRKWRQPQ